MKILPFVLGIILLVALAAVPASAFKAQDLSIVVLPNGDAQVDFSYQLTWLEQAAVFAQIVNPAQQLQSAIEQNFHVPVTVSRVSSGETVLVISSFAPPVQGTAGTTYTTPALSFARAQEALNRYWFAPLIQPDFAPAITTVTFPDGYQQTFTNQIAIPSISHTVS